jgi:hypothetical protein
VPTVIDSLVLVLGLDTSSLGDDQRKALQAVQDMEDQLKRVQERSKRESDTGIVSFFRAIENPLGALRRQFEHLATTSIQPKRDLQELGETAEQTGEKVESSALKGAAGLRIMGAAGLGAFAAFEVLKKGMEYLNETADRVIATGTGAAAAGLPVNQFGAISQALNRYGFVPQEQTQAWLANYNEMVNQARRGIEPGVNWITQFQSQLHQWGIDDIARFETPDQMIYKLAADLNRLPEDKAYSVGKSIGLDENMVRGLRTLGSHFPERVAEERGRAPTAEEQAAAAKLATATHDLSLAFNNLANEMLLVTGPLTGLISLFARLLNFFSENPQQRSSTDTALGVAGSFFWPLGLAVGAYRVLNNWWKGGGSTTTGGSETGAVGSNVIGGGVESTLVSALRSSGANDQAIQVMLSAAYGEGGVTESWVPNKQGSSARGHWQMLGAEMRRYLSEGNTPGDSADQARYTLKRLNEIMPGFSSSTDLNAQLNAITKFESSGQGPGYYAAHLARARSDMATIASGTKPPETASVSNTRYSYIPGSGPSGVMTDSEFAAFMQQQQHYQATQAENAAPANNNHNYGDVNYTAHTTVNAPLREGSAIGDAVAAAQQRVVQSSLANTSGF